MRLRYKRKRHVLAGDADVNETLKTKDKGLSITTIIGSVDLLGTSINGQNIVKLSESYKIDRRNYFIVQQGI